MLLHLGRDPASFDSQTWQRIPTTLIRRIGREVAEAANAVADCWSQYANEEACTGALFSKLRGSRIDTNGWRADIEFVEFSKQTKEPETGADAALLLDVLARDGDRAVKTIWLQAKKHPLKPGNWRTLPRLDVQVADMRKLTPASYGLIYTPDGVWVVGPDLPPGVSKLDDLVQASLECTVGDHRTGVYVQSVNRVRASTIFVTEKA
ncbi:hypothetical protein [Cyanobium sp. Lug-B]|uniref:hypothetical protein n=1 Tax=Cyanobium sp. Lug-B TaxID=2823716 RepID=UPI0020CD0D8B|nr:hypothetical protein [Cyanobium sp. Lug-B]MCP9797107.1 hypothetical protein [Cyanobium sp. Lug-B]